MKRNVSSCFEGSSQFFVLGHIQNYPHCMELMGCGLDMTSLRQSPKEAKISSHELHNPWDVCGNPLSLPRNRVRGQSSLTRQPSLSPWSLCLSRHLPLPSSTHATLLLLSFSRWEKRVCIRPLGHFLSSPEGLLHADLPRLLQRRALAPAVETARSGPGSVPAGWSVCEAL